MSDEILNNSKKIEKLKQITKIIDFNKATSSDIQRIIQLYNTNAININELSLLEQLIPNFLSLLEKEFMIKNNIINATKDTQIQALKTVNNNYDKQLEILSTLANNATTNRTKEKIAKYAVEIAQLQQKDNEVIEKINSNNNIIWMSTLGTLGTLTTGLFCYMFLKKK